MDQSACDELIGRRGEQPRLDCCSSSAQWHSIAVCSCWQALQGLRLLTLRLKAALEPPAQAEAARRRSSRTTGTGPGSRRVTSLHRRTTGQHAVRRISAASLREHRSSVQVLPAPGEQLAAAVSVAMGEACTAAAPVAMREACRCGSIDETQGNRRGTGFAACKMRPIPPSAHPALHAAPSCARLLSADLGAPHAPAHGASIHDRDFFPELPSMLTDVSGRLGTLLSKIVQLEVASAAASETAVAAAQRNAGAGAADGPGEGSLLGSSSSLAATEASEAAVGSTSGRCSSKKLQWADGQAPAADGNGTPQMEGSADSGAVQHAGSGSSCDGEGDTSVAAADGEKALCKGFRRRTWAGPAWLGAVRSGKVRRTPGGAPGEKTNCCTQPRHFTQPMHVTQPKLGVGVHEQQRRPWVGGLHSAPLLPG